MPVVRYKNVSITVYPLETRPGYWQFRDSKGKRVTRADEKAARAAARQTAFEIFDGGIDLTALDGFQLAAIRRMVDADPSCKLVDEFLVWHARQRPAKDIGEAIGEFLAAKEKNRGLSTGNVTNLRKSLGMLPCNKVLSEITPQELETLFNPAHSSRTRRNIRATWITFFRWARRMGYLPAGEELTAAERTEVPIVLKKIPETYSPAEMKILLRNIAPAYLPWLVLSSFAGIRSAEISPDRNSDKSPLDWSDFHWDRDLIIIRPETDKNSRRRVTPILPVVRNWLQPIAKESGRVGAILNAGATYGKGKPAETTRLGGLLENGWKKNAPRHSFISYRAALVGLAQTSMEAGNSESEAKKSYNDAKGADEAKKWFALTRRVVLKLP